MKSNSKKSSEYKSLSHNAIADFVAREHQAMRDSELGPAENGPENETLSNDDIFQALSENDQAIKDSGKAAAGPAVNAEPDEQPDSSAATSAEGGVETNFFNQFNLGQQIKITRPISVVNGRGYSIVWLWPHVGVKPNAYLIRDDGMILTAGEGDTPRSWMSEGFHVQLKSVPLPEQIWGGHGVKAYCNGTRTEPKDAFQRMLDIIEHFIDLRGSFIDEKMLAEVLACYTMSTYFLDAFNVTGYLWPNGEKGSGKTNLLALIADMAFMGQTILPGGTLASLRDMADYGATLAFDDCENYANGKGNSEKRALLLAGTRKGAWITVAESRGDQQKVRYVNTYSARLFSAIELPDPTLGSRTIIVPMLKSLDHNRANIDPGDRSLWPHDRRQLIDDLWNIGLANVSKMNEHYVAINDKVEIMGRNLDPWRGILATALFLEDSGVEGIFDRMNQASIEYQIEKDRHEAEDPAAITVQVLAEMMDSTEGMTLTVETDKVAEQVKAKLKGGSLNPESINNKKVGRILSRLRLDKAVAGRTRRRWTASRGHIDYLAHSHGIKTRTCGLNAENVETPIKT